MDELKARPNETVMAVLGKRPVTVETDVVTITMPRDHAETLLKVLDNVGGEPAFSRRKHTDNIAKAIRTLGVDTGAMGYLEGSLTFRSCIK